MEIELLCKKIFNLVTPYADQTLAPISYVNLEIGYDVEFSENELWAAFNKVRWDSSLASAELAITRKPKDEKQNFEIEDVLGDVVVSVSLFEEEEKSTQIILVENGLIT